MKDAETRCQIFRPAPQPTSRPRIGEPPVEQRGSPIREHLPLLAPLLFVVFVRLAYRAARAWGRSEWSVIHHKDGRQVATINHDGCDRAKLEQLLGALRERAGSRSDAGS